MSLFGTSPPAGEPPAMESPFAGSRHSLFDEGESPAPRPNSTSLFADDDLGGSGAGSPWDMPTPRKQHSRADLVRNLLPPSDAPDAYADVFDAVVGEDGAAAKVGAAGVARTLAAAKLAADDQSKIMGIVAPGGGRVALGRGEFNCLLALVGLAQEGEAVSLDAVDERRKNLPRPNLPGLVPDSSGSSNNNDNSGRAAAAVFAGTSDLSAKLPQRPVTPTKPAVSSPPNPRGLRKPSMDYPEDPWNTPDARKNHTESAAAAPNGVVHDAATASPILNGHGSARLGLRDEGAASGRTTSVYTTTAGGSEAAASGQISFADSSTPAGGWGAGFFDNNPSSSGNGSAAHQPASLFGGLGGAGAGAGGAPGDDQPGAPAPSRMLGSGRTGVAIEENIIVTLLPEKEGMFMFQHHNYEVASVRRGSKVVRRYSDFAWLLDCLHKRFPFRMLPLLPPKRVAVNGNHLSNDGAFIEKRRRGLARFLNALARHPVLGQEQLVIMFLTIPTELSVWRKQATISVQDEFTGRALPPGLEDSLPAQLEDLFVRSRAGVKRSAELYITACNVMDRLVKRSEGVAADHARIALSLTSLVDASADTYATDTNDVPLLNDGLQAMSRHLRTAQSLMEDEARAWDEGVLEDLKRQRDALVSVRDMFDRRERLDKDTIPHLERRIQANETKLGNLRAKPEGLVKPGEIEKVVEAIIKDKESIVNQHNRSVFVKECIRDELVYFQQTQFHVSRWNQDWAQERVKYSEMLADNWRRLLDELEGMPLGN